MNILTDRRDIFGPVNAEDPFAPPPRQRFEQLPSLQFRLYPNRIANTPLYLSLESSHPERGIVLSLVLLVVSLGVLVGLRDRWLGVA